MKIAYFITGLGLGGAEIITIDLAQKAIRAGHEVIIVYLTDIGTLASKIPSEIPVFPLHLQKNPLQFIRAVEKAKSIIKQFRPDIVHSKHGSQQYFHPYVTIPYQISRAYLFRT